MTYKDEKLRATFGLALLGLDEYSLNICNTILHQFGLDLILFDI